MGTDPVRAGEVDSALGREVILAAKMGRAWVHSCLNCSHGCGLKPLGFVRRYFELWSFRADSG